MPPAPQGAVGQMLGKSVSVHGPHPKLAGKTQAPHCRSCSQALPAASSHRSGPWLRWLISCSRHRRCLPDQTTLEARDKVRLGPKPHSIVRAPGSENKALRQNSNWHRPACEGNHVLAAGALIASDAVLMTAEKHKSSHTSGGVRTCERKT